MKHCNKKLLARVLCLFFVFSAFGGGLLSSGKWLGEGQSYAIDELLTAGEHEVNPEDGEILDEDGITESGMEDGADVDVEEKTEDEDTVKAENAEGQEKRSKRMIALSDESIEPQADGDTGDFVVTGGTYGVDYEYKDVSYKNLTYGTNESTAEDAKPPHTVGSHAAWTQKSLVIKSNKSLTVSTKQQTNAGIYIAPGVQADLTFAGVDIRAYLPVNIASNTGREQGAAYDSNPVSISGESTSLHLTLADESTNTLTCITDGDYTIQAPGIRCGEGSKLVIDDGRRNVDQNGQPVLPKDGKISRDATLADGTVVKAGDRLTILDSAKPGKLTVNGGYRAAAIGGGPIENSGDMTFNGGMIKAYAFGPYNDLYGAGAGIGGGHAGGGTQITINGGDIEAEGSVHGAGVGGGCTYARGMSPTTTYAFSDAILCKTPSSTIAGNININGGYIKAKGFQHGNAFGQGCAGTNKGKKIVITGGTLLPTSQNGTDAAGSPLCDVGGREGNVIVTGGSIRLTDNNPDKFQGTGWSNVAMTEDVFRITIDLSGEKIDGKPVENNAIAFWSLSIGGVECDYGAHLISMMENFIYGCRDQLRTKKSK